MPASSGTPSYGELNHRYVKLTFTDLFIARWASTKEIRGPKTGGKRGIYEVGIEIATLTLRPSSRLSPKRQKEEDDWG